MFPITSTTPAFSAETGGHHQRPHQQWQGQEERENAASPSLRGKQEEPLHQHQPLPPPRQQYEEGQQEQGPALFPTSDSPTTTTINSNTASSSSSSSSSSSCPNFEGMVDTFFAQARCKFVRQFDEITQTMSVSMKAEIAVQAERQRQSRVEWEGSVNTAHKKEVQELRGTNAQLTAELDMLRLPMMDTPSELRSGMLFMSGKYPRNPCGTPAVGAGKSLGTPASRLSLFSSPSGPRDINVGATPGSEVSPSPFMRSTPSMLRSGMLCMPRRDPKIPCDTPKAGTGKPLRTPASRLSLYSSSSASGEIDVTATSGGGMSPSSVWGSFPPASAIKPASSPSMQQPPQPQPQSQPQPRQEQPQQFQQQQQQQQQQQPHLQPSEAPAIGIVATTSPVASRPATPSSALLTDARTAAYVGACSTTSNHAAAAAAAVAAQSAFLAAYYSGNNQSMPSDPPPPAISPVVASASAVASATPAAFTASLDISPTIGSTMDTLEKHHPTDKITPQGSETVHQPGVAKAAAPHPAAASVTNIVARGVGNGAVTTEFADAPVMAPSAAVTAAATMPEATPPPPFMARLLSAGRRSSMPAGGISRRRTSVPARLPFAVFNENMPPPQPRTPVSAKKAPMRFGATPARSPLGVIRVNAAATHPSPAVDAIATAKVRDGSEGAIGGGCDGGGAVGRRDTREANEKMWDGKRQASAIAASATKKGRGDALVTSPSPRKSSSSVVAKRAKKALPQSQRVLRSASRASRVAVEETGAAAAAAATEEATKCLPPRASTAEAARPRATRSATLRSATGRASGGRGGFMKF